MARLTGIPPFTGTVGPVCIYQMYGRYFMRTRSSLTRQRVKKDPAFRNTMAYARLLSKASRIGSAVYAALPPKRKRHALYRKLTGEAMTWLKYQWTAEATQAWLMKQYVQQYTPFHTGDHQTMTGQSSLRRPRRTDSRSLTSLFALTPVAAPGDHNREYHHPHLRGPDG